MIQIIDYPLASDKTKIEKKMLFNYFNYQLRIASFYNIHICTVKELMPKFLVKKERSSLGKLANFFKARIEAKNCIAYPS